MSKPSEDLPSTENYIETTEPDSVTATSLPHHSTSVINNDHPMNEIASDPVDEHAPTPTPIAFLSTTSTSAAAELAHTSNSATVTAASQDPNDTKNKPSIISNPQVIEKKRRGRPKRTESEKQHIATAINSLSTLSAEGTSVMGNSVSGANGEDKPRSAFEKYKLAKLKYSYISRENEVLREEYAALKTKLRRLRIERSVLLDVLLADSQRAL
ncbi:uncharacterized protein VTP21DRAFT_10708 [Calcarisporiella thermophila]|uniref:uncharacterized protein n=1 Tax=Calcarisporiella thermophila TaxID=911321 RepID=UPI0037436ACB